MSEERNLKNSLTYVDTQSAEINNIINGIVKKYSHEMDEFVSIVETCLQLVKTNQLQEYSIEDLQMQSLKLPTILYFAGDGLEAIGCDMDIAEYRKKELYNEIMESLKNSGYTIPDKKASAESRTAYETMVCSIYDRAYKRYKLKLDHATKLLESIKKVLDLRIAKINKGRGGDEQNVRQYRTNQS